MNGVIGQGRQDDGSPRGAAARSRVRSIAPPRVDPKQVDSTRVDQPRLDSSLLDRARPTRRRFVAQLTFLAVGGAFFAECSNPSSTRRRADDLASAPPAPIEPTAAAPTPPPPPVRAPLPHAEPALRVRVAASRPGAAAPQPIVINADARWIVVRSDNRLRQDLTLQAPISVSRERGEWRIVDRSGFTPRYDAQSPIEFAIEESAGGSLIVGEARYPGSLVAAPLTPPTLRPIEIAASADPSEDESLSDEASPEDDASPDAADSADSFDIVNHVPLEMYLPGVLAGELFSHWHAEAFAAQAVAARSYACCEAFFWGTRRHFDVTATTTSQVYRGETALRVAREAVERTRGRMLGWDGALVPAYYSSCCGGIAANAIDEVSPNPVNDIPPLRSRTGPDACGDAPVRRWTNARSIDELVRRLNAWGAARRNAGARAIRSIASFDVAAVNDHGRPTKFLVRDRDGREALVSSMRLREAVNFNAPGTGPPREALKSSLVQPVVSGPTITFHGQGYGHGVGLCQYCAQALAKGGTSHPAMLTMFYPQATLASAY
jgi:stage II sporulation protein D